MNLYKTAIISFGMYTPKNIVCSYHSATALAFTFDPVTGATGYEYTTDGGKTFLPIQSGVHFTTDSAGNSLVENWHYPIQIRSVDSKYNDKSKWSSVVDGFTSGGITILNTDAIIFGMNF